MGLQKYRADIKGEPDANCAVPWYARWMGGPSLSKITNCPVLEGLYTPRTVYIQSEPDTMFSQPAACRVRGKVIRGYVTFVNGCYLFNPYKDDK